MYIYIYVCMWSLLLCRTASATYASRAGSGVVRIDPLHFLARCRKRRLNQVCLLYILACFIVVLLFIRAHFYVLLVFVSIIIIFLPTSRKPLAWKGSKILNNGCNDFLFGVHCVEEGDRILLLLLPMYWFKWQCHANDWDALYRVIITVRRVVKS